MKNVSADKEKQQQSCFESEITGTTRQRPAPSCQRRIFFGCPLPHRMYVNAEISSRTFNYQLYQIKEPENDFRCRFEINSAAKQTQA